MNLKGLLPLLLVLPILQMVPVVALGLKYKKLKQLA